MDFSTAIRTCLQKYVTFQGRAPRSEYWFYVLFQLLAIFVAFGIDLLLQTPMIFYSLVGLGLLLPSISVMVRRLHDTNRSGWWYWIVLIPLVGFILLLVWFCSAGTNGPNDYGPDPLA